MRAQFCPSLNEGCPEPVNYMSRGFHDESIFVNTGAGYIVGTIPIEIM
jgi:hypothetical protein